MQMVTCIRIPPGHIWVKTWLSLSYLGKGKLFPRYEPQPVTSKFSHSFKLLYIVCGILSLMWCAVI